MKGLIIRKVYFIANNLDKNVIVSQFLVLKNINCDMSQINILIYIYYKGIK